MGIYSQFYGNTYIFGIFIYYRIQYQVLTYLSKVKKIEGGKESLKHIKRKIQDNRRCDIKEEDGNKGRDKYQEDSNRKDIAKGIY